MNLGDDDVLVVTSLHQDCGAIGVARQVWRHAVGGGADQELVAVVQLRALLRATPVHGVEVERERAAVHEALDVNSVGWLRLVVECQVVIDELAEKGDAGGCALGIVGRDLLQHSLRELGKLLIRLLVERLEDLCCFGSYPDREHSPEA